MKNTVETRLGIFVALAVIVAVLILETLGGLDRFRRGYQVQALFNTAQELKRGDRVKMAGVDVGDVQDISLTNNKVLVTMKLKSGTPVKTDSVASIRWAGLMGQSFVAIEFGGPDSPHLAENQLLNTEEQPDLNALVKKLDGVAKNVQNFTASFTGDTIDNLIAPLTQFLQDNRVPLTATIANLQSISTEIASGRGTVGMLIYSNDLYNAAYASVTNVQVGIQDVTASVKDVAAEAKLTIAQARRVVDQVNSGQGTIGKLLTDDKLYAETTASMTNLREILEKMNQGQGSVGKLINDQEFYRNAKLTLQKLDKATEGLEDQGPLSVMGLLVGSFF